MHKKSIDFGWHCRYLCSPARPSKCRTTSSTYHTLHHLSLFSIFSILSKPRHCFLLIFLFFCSILVFFFLPSYHIFQSWNPFRPRARVNKHAWSLLRISCSLYESNGNEWFLCALHYRRDLCDAVLEIDHVFKHRSSKEYCGYDERQGKHKFEVIEANNVQKILWSRISRHWHRTNSAGNVSIFSFCDLCRERTSHARVLPYLLPLWTKSSIFRKQCQIQQPARNSAGWVAVARQKITAPFCSRNPNVFSPDSRGTEPIQAKSLKFFRSTLTVTLVSCTAQKILTAWKAVAETAISVLLAKLVSPLYLFNSDMKLFLLLRKWDVCSRTIYCMKRGLSRTRLMRIYRCAPNQASWTLCIGLAHIAVWAIPYRSFLTTPFAKWMKVGLGLLSLLCRQTSSLQLLNPSHNSWKQCLARHVLHYLQL